MDIQNLNKELGNIDLYLLDQILKNRISKGMKILDAGCGEGRNIIYFLNNGYNVYGTDQNPDTIRLLHFILGSKYPNYPKQNFTIGELQNLPFKSGTFDYIICSAVLHFAKSVDEFWTMIAQLTNVLNLEGTLFIRMTSDIGLMGHKDYKNGVFKLPDNSFRFLLTGKMIDVIKSEYGYIELEPIKTVLVNNQRCMTTLVLKKIK